VLSPEEAHRIMPLVIGRLLRIASRPEQPGDALQFANLRYVAFACAEALSISTTDNRPLPFALVLDRHKGIGD
jgi:hypothetical protein